MPIIKDTEELCIAKNSRALGIDYGDKRVGIAVSDVGFSMAFPLTVLESHNIFDKLFKIIDEYNICFIVIGEPVTLSGESGGKQFDKVGKFTEKLLSIKDIDILMWDERLSTHAAMRHISQADISRSKQNKIRDKISASFILEGALLCLKSKGIIGK